MRQIFIPTLAAVSLLGCVENRNVPLPYSINDALQYEDYKAQVEGIRYYFGNQRHPPIGRNLGEVRTAQRAQVVEDKQPKEVCARAFTSAMLRLKAAALKEGGDAVINIKSNWKNHEVVSNTHFQCATGVLMSGVALNRDSHGAGIGLSPRYEFLGFLNLENDVHRTPRMGTSVMISGTWS